MGRVDQHNAHTRKSFGHISRFGRLAGSHRWPASGILCRLFRTI
jgi:hypothetical protein